MGGKYTLAVLENAGLKVCIDFRDFEAGFPSFVNMENAVDDSRQTVLVLTPNWTDSEWTDFESILTQTDDPVGRRKKMIPLMWEKCTSPKRIKTLTYLDFMRADRIDIAWKQLFTALGKPDAPILITSPKEAKPETSLNWCLAHPYPMPPNFTGCETERELLTSWLQNDSENLLFIHCASVDLANQPLPGTG